MDSVHHLFSTPLQQTTLDVPQEVLQFIKSQEFHFHGNGYMTHEYILECPEMKNIKSFITDKVKSYLYDTCCISDTMTPELVTSWANLHKKENWAQAHIHMNSIVSGVWFISGLSENSGQFVVHCQNKLFGNLLDFPRKETVYNYVLDRNYFSPKIGDLIFFPSDLKHSVTANRSDEERFSLAFNYMLRGNVISGNNTSVKL